MEKCFYYGYGTILNHSVDGRANLINEEYLDKKNNLIKSLDVMKLQEGEKLEIELYEYMKSTQAFPATYIKELYTNLLHILNNKAEIYQIRITMEKNNTNLEFWMENFMWKNLDGLHEFFQD